MRPRFPALVPALLVAVAFAAPCRAADDSLAQARAALRQGDADKALAFADKAVAADPANPDAHLTRGLIHAALRRPKDAVADFDKVLELDPKRSEVFDLRGSEQFKRGLFAESVADFDRFLKDHPEEKAGHWRRGISLYYAGQYDEGRKQFEGYEKVDANDVENAVWHFLCKARADGVEKARAAMLKIGKDKRVPMMQVYDLYHGDLKPDDVLAAAEAGDVPPGQRAARLFYAHLYLGLYFDATGDKKQALEHMTAAAHKYRIDHYMGEAARVHEELLLKEKKD